MAASKSQVKTVPVEEIPEVGKFVQEQERFKQFRKDNAQFFEYLTQLATDYNEALSAARAACKQRGVSCGPIQVATVQTKYDADAMYDVLGREKFLEMGGTLETVQKRGLDKKRVDFNIDNGKIEADQAALIRKRNPTFKSNDVVSVPGDA